MCEQYYSQIVDSKICLILLIRRISKQNSENIIYTLLDINSNTLEFHLLMIL